MAVFLLLVGFGASLLVKLIQLVTGWEIFDVDNLFTNTLGAIFGWGLIMALRTLIHREHNWGNRCCGYLTVPVSFLLSMAILFGYYVGKPYGNLPNGSVMKADLSEMQWEIKTALEDTPTTAPVYLAGRADKDSSEKFAQTFAEANGLQFEDVYYYNTEIIYADYTSGDFLHHYKRDGTWIYDISEEHQLVFDCKATEITPEKLVSVWENWGYSTSYGDI